MILYNDLFKKNFTKNHLIGLGIINRFANEEQYKFFNSFSVFDNNLNLIKKYNKVNLVPFGEFLPFERFLNKIGLKTITNNFGSFTSGEKRKIKFIYLNNISFFTTRIRLIIISYIF